LVTIKKFRDTNNALKLVLFFTTAYFIIQILSGFRIGSLALISDAGHMLIDVGVLVMGILAIRFTKKPATPKQTYGFYRSEILVSFLNSLFLMLLSIYILYEVYQRIHQAPEINGLPMLLVATVGLSINLLGLYILHPHTHSPSKHYRMTNHNSIAEENLNVRAIYIEVLADTIGSVGVIVAGIIIFTTKFYIADPLASIAIAALIIPRTWSLLKKTIHILIEGTPSHLSHEEIKNSILKIRGVTGVFDLHIWTITSGIHALSAHVVIMDQIRAREVLQEINSILENNFKINHATIQIESYHESDKI
jgi:cobalt-zinc-cadmium efflux system protein